MLPRVGLSLCLCCDKNIDPFNLWPLFEGNEFFFRIQVCLLEWKKTFHPKTGFQSIAQEQISIWSWMDRRDIFGGFESELAHPNAHMFAPGTEKSFLWLCGWESQQRKAADPIKYMKEFLFLCHRARFLQYIFVAPPSFPALLQGQAGQGLFTFFKVSRSWWPNSSWFFPFFAMWCWINKWNFDPQSLERVLSVKLEKPLHL